MASSYRMSERDFFLFFFFSLENQMFIEQEAIQIREEGNALLRLGSLLIYPQKLIS